jgi:CRP/FNR family transcriptional regulator, cyclic AMP receptor protein
VDGDKIIKQGDNDNDIYFILQGTVKIFIHDKYMYPREKRNHVGEMSLISPDEKRSGTVVAEGDVSTIKVSQSDFEKIADSEQGKGIWRALASEISERLRQRNGLLRPSNLVPHIFIGCAAEDLGTAKELRSCFSHEKVEIEIWTDKTVFKAGTITLTELQEKAKLADFAVMIWTPIDKTISRSRTSDSARDNVIFEFGLFMGAIGHERSLLVRPRQKIKIPSDLEGLTPITYNSDLVIHSQMQMVATEILRIIEDKGVR